MQDQSQFSSPDDLEDGANKYNKNKKRVKFEQAEEEPEFNHI